MKVEWEHVVQVPEEIRHTMGRIWAKWDVDDLKVEGALELLIRNDEVRDVTCQAMRTSATLVRVPEFVNEILKAHAGLKRIQAFCAVSLFLGVSKFHVRNLYYGLYKPKSGGGN